MGTPGTDVAPIATPPLVKKANGKGAEVVTARALMQSRREEYLEANRHLKVVQRLEEKARSNHRTEAQRVEQAALDEFAGYAAARRPVLT